MGDHGFGRARSSILESMIVAHLWFRDASAAWFILPLEADAYALDAMPPRPVTPPVPARRDSVAATPARAGSPARALLLRAGGEETEAWFAIGGGDGEIVVNGLPLSLGVRALSDRDEVRAAGGDSLFFSTETLAHPVPYPGGLPKASCPRCLQELEAGVAAVRCPGCGVWHHECNELPCWTHGPRCQLCPQPSALDAGYRWSPEDL